MITVLSPTHNRGYCLGRAYESLLNQSAKDFEWIVVDDGSTDNTRQVVQEWISDGRIPIRYYFKDNGGKHTALNLGIQKTAGELVLILDSDDYLTHDAVETVVSEWRTVKHLPEVAGLHMLKGYQSNGRCIGTEFPTDRTVESTIRTHFWQGVTGDKAKIIRTEVLRRYPFPVFDGESFLPEGVVWNRIAKTYSLLHVNKVIYLAEYLEDGLSKNRDNFGWRHLQGIVVLTNDRTTSEFPWRWRLRSMVSYISHSIAAGIPCMEMIRNANQKILCIISLPVGVGNFLWQRIRYKKRLNQLVE